MMSEKDNKGTNKKRSKRSEPKTSPSVEEKSTDKLVEAALRSHLLEYASKKQQRSNSLRDTATLVQDHMSSFVILGYDYNGNPIQCINVNTQQEADSLCALVNKFVMQHSSPY